MKCIEMPGKISNESMDCYVFHAKQRNEALRFGTVIPILDGQTGRG